MFSQSLVHYVSQFLSDSSTGDEIEPGEIWERPAIPSLISMNVPPPPKSKNRANNLQQQANQRWEHHKLTGWKGPDPPVRVQPQIHGALQPTGRGRGAWKKGGTLHSVQPPHPTPSPNVRPPQVLSWHDYIRISFSVFHQKLRYLAFLQVDPQLPVLPMQNQNAVESAESPANSRRRAATEPHRIVPPTNDNGR